MLGETRLGDGGADRAGCAGRPGVPVPPAREEPATGVRADRPWAAGEVVRLLVDTGAVLQDLHARGRAHGRVGDPTAWSGESSPPVLLAAAWDATGSPAQDVRALARTALTLLGRLPGECVMLPADVAAPDGDTWCGAEAADVTGSCGHRWDDADAVDRLVPAVPGCADDDVPRERLRHVLLLAAHREPAATPVALLVAQALAVADPVPPGRPDAAVLARDALVRSAGVSAVPVRGRHRRRGPARGVLLPLLSGTAALALGLAALPSLTRGPAAPAGEGGHAASGAVGAPAVRRVEEPAPYRSSGPDERLEGDVVVLTRARAAALARGDVLRLLRVTVPGSPAALADLELFTRLHLPRSGGLAPDDAAPGAPGPPVPDGGLDVRVEQVSALPGDGAATRVLLVAAVGHADAEASGPARGVVLSMSEEAGVWRVRDVASAEAEGTG